MKTAKVRHGGITWEIKGENGRMQTETAFRGQTVNLPDEEYDRLMKQQAIIGADEELKLDGKIMPLPSTASDVELVAWASVANREDILAACNANPKLADRIMAAYENVQQQIAAQNELLGGLREIKQDQEAQAEAARKAAEAAQKPDPGNQKVEAVAAAARAQAEADAAKAASESGSGTDEDDELEDPDEVVKRNVDGVSQYLSEHPEAASDILEAENRRASANGAKPPHPRDGIIKAAQVAAEFNATH